jgi:hypothetical protein
MNKLYTIKTKPQPVGGKIYWGFKGNETSRSWNEIVELIVKHGIAKVEYVQHCDKKPTNYKRLSGKEMLTLWQAAARHKPSIAN